MVSEEQVKELNEKILKLNQINTTLNDEKTKLTEQVNNLQLDLEKKQNAIGELTNSYNLEKAVNSRMQKIFETSQKNDKPELTKQEKLQQAYDELKNIKKPVKEDKKDE